jgi:homoserine dehydrogenase
MTTDWQEVVNDPQIHVVIELVGGTGIAKAMILAALTQGKTVVTANKALLSAHGPELFAAAAKSGANLYYEASVCGGIPIIKSLREGFVANQFPAIYGIVNGTCNYILSRMKQEGAEFADVLADAQKQGYAETPPDLDIDGKTRSTRSAFSPRWRTASGWSTTRFTRKAFATCPRLTCSSRPSWVTPSSCSAS